MVHLCRGWSGGSYTVAPQCDLTTHGPAVLHERGKAPTANCSAGLGAGPACHGVQMLLASVVPSPGGTVRQCRAQCLRRLTS